MQVRDGAGSAVSQLRTGANPIPWGNVSRSPGVGDWKAQVGAPGRCCCRSRGEIGGEIVHL